MLASGIEIRTADALSSALDELEAAVGAGRVGSLHLNDSETPLGSNRDRHANIGEGEIGLDGCRVFLSEPRFAALPCVLETPGPDRSGATAAEVALCVRLRDEGLAARVT
jgi:deoxyribonuclease-4